MKQAESGTGSSIESISLNGGTPSAVDSDPRDGKLGIAVDEKSGLPSGPPAKITDWSDFAVAEGVSQNGKHLAVIKSHALAREVVRRFT